MVEALLGVSWEEPRDSELAVLVGVWIMMALELDTIFLISFMGFSEVMIRSRWMGLCWEAFRRGFNTRCFRWEGRFLECSKSTLCERRNLGVLNTKVNM